MLARLTFIQTDAQRLLEKLIANRERLVTDAEALQEILHRYVAIDRRDAIQPAFDALLGVVGQAFPGIAACRREAVQKSEMATQVFSAGCSTQIILPALPVRLQELSTFPAHRQLQTDCQRRELAGHGTYLRVAPLHKRFLFRSIIRRLLNLGWCCKDSHLPVPWDQF